MTLSTTIEQRAELADRIRDALDTGNGTGVHVVYEPGDMTRYEFVLTPLSGTVLEGFSYTGDERALRPYVERGRWLMADPEQCRAMTVDLTPGHYTDPQYVKEKWSPKSEWTAIVLAELLCMVAGCDLDTRSNMRMAYGHVFGHEVTG